jgi:hypothetical protein
MIYKVIRDPVADAEIDDFGRYAADYSESFARKQFARLNRFFTVEIAESPKIWSYFYITAPPIALTCFTPADERTIGSSIPSTTTRRPSTCYASGTREESRRLLKSKTAHLQLRSPRALQLLRLRPQSSVRITNIFCSGRDHEAVNRVFSLDNDSPSDLLRNDRWL